MPTIAAQLEKALRAAILAGFGIDADPQLAATPPAQARFGDYQANAAMSLGRQIVQKTPDAPVLKPREIAQRIQSHLDLGDLAEEVSIAGPGFINIRLSAKFLAQRLQEGLADPRLGIDLAAEPQTVVVDYSGPNIAKQMHVGHLRSTIIGDAISRVIEFQGHKVIRQNHIGDWGTQFGMLIAYLKSTGGTAEKIADLENFYRQAKTRFDQDPAFADESRQTVVRLQSHAKEEMELWRKIVEETRRHYQPVYQQLGVKLTAADERGESSYNDLLGPVVRELQDKQIAVASEGAVAVFVEGFDNPLLIEKTGGGYLYGTTDLAAIKYRVQELHAGRIIYTHDSRQAQHFAMVFATARRAGWTEGPGGVSLEFAPFGTMLGEDGKPFKTRSGDTVKLKDLLDEAEVRAFTLVSQKNPELPEEQRRAIAAAVGIGGVKYSDLAKDRISDYVFSWDKMLAMDGNTAPYLQYAFARIQSIFRKAGEEAPHVHAGLRIELAAPAELSLARHIVRLGEVIEQVGRELKPHHLCGYLYELATRFSGFYENCPVLQSEEPMRSSRLALCRATARTLALGLDLLGIEHPDQM